MNIKESLSKIKSFDKLKIKAIENDLILVLVVLCVAMVAFGLGRLSVVSEKRTPVTVEYIAANISGATSGLVSGGSEEKLFVASKNGTKYHYPWCSGAQSIKEENKIWFSTKEEAQAAGYTPAANCKGL